MQPLKAVLEVLCRHDVVVVLDGDLEEDLNLLQSGTRSRQPLGTLRSPPRPRGGANRAGERVPPLFLLEPPGPVAQRT